MPDRYAIGVDFGGTKVLAGVINTRTGKLMATSKKKTRQQDAEKEVIKRLESVIDEAIDDSGVDHDKITGIGIGVAGMVDREKGILLNAVNIGAKNIKLTGPLARNYGVPAVIGNDVEVATLGEMHFGAGKDCDNFVCVFVGTGIGSGIVTDGEIYRGASGTAGEIGHTILFPEGRQCNCGGHGCLEAYASRTAIAKQIVAGIKRGKKTNVADEVDESKGWLRSKVLSEAVDNNDPLVVECIKEGAKFLGIGLASVVNFYNPEKIVLGGGLVDAVDLYIDVATDVVMNTVLPIPRKNLQVRKAKLGDYAGIVGAAILAAQNGN